MNMPSKVTILYNSDLPTATITAAIQLLLDDDYDDDDADENVFPFLFLFLISLSLNYFFSSFISHCNKPHRLLLTVRTVLLHIRRLQEWTH